MYNNDSQWSETCADNPLTHYPASHFTANTQKNYSKTHAHMLAMNKYWCLNTVYTFFWDIQCLILFIEHADVAQL